MGQFARRLNERLAELAPDGGPGVVAVSGGPDSVALLCGLAQSRPAGAGVLVVGHVNHALRGPDSDADAEFVHALADALAVHARIARIETAPLGGNLEATARRERYRWLAGLANSVGAGWVATGHTADDQAETVLFRALRGTGIRGLCGIPAVRPLADGVRLVRPMLGVTRDQVLDFLGEIGQSHRTDASNADPRFSRNRIRTEILPLMRELNPKAGEALARLASQAGEVIALVDRQAAEALGRAELPPAGAARRLSLPRTRELPRHLIRELFRRLWEREGWPSGRMRQREWDALADLATGDRRAVDLPGGMPARRRGGVITLGPWPGRTAGDKIPDCPTITTTPIREASLMGRPIRRALLSVSDKTGLVELGRALAELGVELISTGGTRRELADAGLSVRDVSEVTGFPEILDGRVKTLHPHVHAAILARRDDPAHEHTLQINGITPVDLVVCNLYPFEKVTADPSCEFATAIENVDVGGPTMIRAAAKNHAHVAVLSDPRQYDDAIAEMQKGDGSLSGQTRRRLAAFAFARTAAYDAAIAAYFERTSDDPDRPRFAEVLRLELRRVGGELRSGENPHQPAALYAERDAGPGDLVRAEQLHGKELSFNNYLDSDAALALVREFDEPAAAVIKHTNPCGLATADDLAEAFRLAFDGDPLSAFGGILSFNRPVDRATAEAITQPGRFIECVIAPDYEPDALALLRDWKKNVRLLRCPGGPGAALDYRRVSGGMLVQEPDRGADDPARWECVTQRRPDEALARSLWFAWRAVKHVKSNAIVLANGTRLVGTGAGQMSRVDSVRIACEKAGERSRGAVLASDAFFPFRDNVDRAAAAGVVALVQPGGSQRDDESIAACDEHGIVMMFTGVRHFRH